MHRNNGRRKGFHLKSDRIVGKLNFEFSRSEKEEASEDERDD